jgi:hypothetical protein
MALGGKRGVLFPDTLLPATRTFEVIPVRPGGRFVLQNSINWERVISQLPKDTLSVFFFHTDTLNKYAWEEIRDRYMILRRYDLSLDDFRKLQNRFGIPEIPFPPDERMRDMRMFPPFGE